MIVLRDAPPPAPQPKAPLLPAAQIARDKIAAETAAMNPPSLSTSTSSAQWWIIALLAVGGGVYFWRKKRQ